MKLSKFKPVSGIYKITNLKNGRVYIGQSINVQMRWATHVDDLVNGRHINAAMLEDFQLYGIGAFEIEIIEKCKTDKNLLLKREEFHIAQFHQQGCDVYNKILAIYATIKPPVKEWTVAWKPIDRAKAKPKFSGVRFDSFIEADRAASMLNASDPESQYFPTLTES